MGDEEFDGLHWCPFCAGRLGEIDDILGTYYATCMLCRRELAWDDEGYWESEL